MITFGGGTVIFEIGRSGEPNSSKPPETGVVSGRDALAAMVRASVVGTVVSAPYDQRRLAGVDLGVASGRVKFLAHQPRDYPSVARPDTEDGEVVLATL